MTRTVAPSEVSLDTHDRVATLTMSRPPLNILDLPLLRHLDATLASLDSSGDWRVLVLRGIPKAFSAGVAVEDHLPDRLPDTLAAFHSVLSRLESIDRPVIAVVRGHCLGGGMELAMACDIVASAETATFGQPEIRLAAIPPYAVARYERLVGPRRAFMDLATGRTFPATEAMAAGYVTACLADDALDGWVSQAISALSSLSPIAIRVLKRALRGTSGADALTAVEDRYVQELAGTSDAIEGLRAFLEKRSPRWGAIR